MKAWGKLIRVTVVATWLVVLCLLVVPKAAYAQFATPTVDGAQRGNTAYIATVKTRKPTALKSGI